MTYVNTLNCKSANKTQKELRVILKFVHSSLKIDGNEVFASLKQKGCSGIASAAFSCLTNPSVAQ
jgi:hypothetical protein